MAKRGRPRSATNLPSHIDRAKLPDGIYWDASGRGHWYIVRPDTDGKPHRKRVAGPGAQLSDLHAVIEAESGIMRGTFSWVAEQFKASTQYAALSEATRKDYEYCRGVVVDHPTKIGIKLGDAQLDKWSRPMVQRLIDGMAKDRGPSTAAHVLRYLRRLFEWAMNRGHVTSNPARGVEAPKERKQRRCPEVAVYNAILEFSKTNGAPYLWIVMELAYLLRLRGIEIVTLTDAHERPDGIMVERRKGSRGNLTEWGPRLRKAWDAAKELRKKTREAHKLPIPADPAKRWLFPASDGQHLRKSSLDSAWQRMIHAAMSEDHKIITEDQRFSPHDLKRAGVTRTKGTWAEKRQASGHLDDKMQGVYDLEVPIVRPTEE